MTKTNIGYIVFGLIVLGIFAVAKLIYQEISMWREEKKICDEQREKKSDENGGQ